MSIHTLARRAGPLSLALVLGAILASLIAVRPPAQAQEPAGAPYTTYLPGISTVGRRGNSGENTAGRSGAYLFTTEVKTNDAAMVVDARGGLHVAFKTFVAEVEHPTAYYGYCPGTPLADCAKAAGWTYTSFGDRVDEVQLALSPAGKPRLLWRQRQESSLNYDYIYAACDAASCTAEGTWQGLVVLSAALSGAFDKDNPQRGFAIDPEGRPRFVYTNAWGAGKPEGVYYVQCDLDCANPDAAQWSETRLVPDEQYKSETLDYPSLAFTADGRPRVVGVTGLSGEQTGLRYLACDELPCDDPSLWTATFLGERGGGPYAGWDLELDGQDRPRVAQYQGSLAAGDLGRLYYLACDAGCDSADAWQRIAVGQPGQGINPDLELDGAGKPRIAYGSRPTAGGLLGYAWCNSASCADTGAPWRQRAVESNTTLNTAFTPALPGHCRPQEQAWTDAIPSLSLDAAGHPRIAYDVLNSAMCYYDLGGGNGTGYRAEKIWRSARVVFFDQP